MAFPGAAFLVVFAVLWLRDVLPRPPDVSLGEAFVGRGSRTPDWLLLLLGVCGVVLIGLS